MKTKMAIIFSIGILMLYGACTKIDDNIFGEASIRGYAYLEDSSNNGLPVPLKNQKVYLGADVSDVHSFYYSTVTDSLGYFSFGFLAEKNYKVFSQVAQNNLIYIGNATLEVKENDVHDVKLILYPGGYNNRLILNFIDTLGGSLGNFPFHIYNNKAAALVDDASLAYYQSTNTSVNGTYSKEDIYPNKYYIVSKKNYAGVIYSSFDSIEIGTTGDYNMSIQLKVSTVYSNELNLALVDIYGGALSNFPLHLYLSRVAAINDQISLAFEISSTNNVGLLKIQNVPPNKYFIVSKDTIGGGVVAAFDSVQVGNSGVYNKIVIVQ